MRSTFRIHSRRLRSTGCLLVCWLTLSQGAACEPQGSNRQRPASSEYSLDDTPEFSIGGHDDRPEYQIQYLVGAVRLSDGRIVVGDNGFHELMYYDAQGRHQHTVGGDGDGPGEFRNLRSIARMRGDTVVTWDSQLRRMSYFDSNGGFALSSVLNWGPVYEDLRTQVPEWYSIALRAVHVSENGDIVVEPLLTPRPELTEGTRVVQDSVRLVAFDREGDRLRELGPFPGSEFFYHNGIGSLLRFGEQLKVVPGRETLFVGSTRDSVIRAVAASGQIVSSITLPIEPRRLAPRDIPANSEGGPLAEFREAIPMPDSMPLFSSVLRGGDGRLWVQEFLAPLDRSQHWLAFHESGEFVATLTMTAEKSLLAVGSDYALVATTDDLNVATVDMYRLRTSRD